MIIQKVIPWLDYSRALPRGIKGLKDAVGLAWRRVAAEGKVCPRSTKQDWRMSNQIFLRSQGRKNRQARCDGDQGEAVSAAIIASWRNVQQVTEAGLIMKSPSGNHRSKTNAHSTD